MNCPKNLVSHDMTWYANHIYAKYEPTLFADLKEHPILGKGLYLVNDISDYGWYRPEQRHGLPENGLVAVREVCSSDSCAAEWHGDDFISWASISGSSNYPVISAEVVMPELRDESHEELVPLGFLHYLKLLSVKNATSLIYYQHFMWGGDTEYERAWIFGNADQAIRFVDYETVVVLRLDNPPERRPGGVLRIVMSELGVQLPSPYFAPHARNFDWNRYRA
jgi:hypothetical protein